MFGRANCDKVYKIRQSQSYNDAAGVKRNTRRRRRNIKRKQSRKH